MENLKSQLRSLSYARYIYPSVLAALLAFSGLVAFGITRSDTPATKSGSEMASAHADFQLVSPDDQTTASAN
jgi:hypothetical protein